MVSYTLKALWGGGKFRQTYFAYQQNSQDFPCIIKRIISLSQDPTEDETLFKEEATLLYRLGVHDQIPKLISRFSNNQEFYFVQEFIEGQTLREELSLNKQTQNKLSEEKVISLLQDMLSILEHFHQVHGDPHENIKPSSFIRRASDNKLVLINFGTACNQQLDPIDLPANIYMPTTQQLEERGVHWDIYCLGMIGIKALTGLEPEKLPPPREKSWRKDVTVSDNLASILEKMIHYNFRDRYQSATEVLTALKNITAPQKLQRDNISPVKPNDKTRKIPPFLLSRGTILVVLLIVVLGAIYSQKKPNNPLSPKNPVVEILDCFKEVAQVPSASDLDSENKLFYYGHSSTFAGIRKLIDPKIMESFPMFKLEYKKQPKNSNAGSATGMMMLLNDELQIGQSSRPIREQEKKEAEIEGFKLKEVAIAKDFLAVAVHPDLDIPGLTLEQLKGIYTGKITNWEQLGGPNLEIIPYSRSLEAGGTVQFFVQNILGGKFIWNATEAEIGNRDDVVKDFEKAIEEVQKTTDGINQVANNQGGIYYSHLAPHERKFKTPFIQPRNK